MIEMAMRKHKRFLTQQEREEEREKVTKERAQRKADFQEKCMACRFFEPEGSPLEERKCTTKWLVDKDGNCLNFIRRWSQGITPVELEE